MKLYLSVIGVAMLIISLVNILFSTAPWYYIIIATVFCTAFHFAVDGFFAFVINKLPNRWFGVNNRFYDVSPRERELYKRLRVRRWKDKVWELGGLGGFSKKALANPEDPAYIERFIIECNKGVATHRIAYPLGFLAMLTLPNICALTVALPTALVNLFLNILPTLALRYNTPMLKSVLKRLERKAEKSESDIACK